VLQPGSCNIERASNARSQFRIGIHVGDVIVEGTNLFGDAVNIAARLEAVAEPGGICVSGTVRDQIRTKLPNRSPSGDEPSVPRQKDDADLGGARERKSGSQWTRRWREQDSNSQSPASSCWP
jgi:class 3 adenylate cyclase